MIKNIGGFTGGKNFKEKAKEFKEAGLKRVAKPKIAKPVSKLPELKGTMSKGGGKFGRVNGRIKKKKSAE